LQAGAQVAQSPERNAVTCNDRRMTHNLAKSMAE
jgi:hypothetical protein